MGCGGSSEPAEPAPAPQYQQRPAPAAAKSSPYGGQQQFGWGGPGGKVVIEPPNPSDPAFMQTVSPSGTTWGQYVRTGSSFVDPRTGFLAGPWAECIAWAVIFEHTNEWGNMPQYAADGVVGGVLSALEAASSGRPNKDAIMEGAERLENASHALAERGEPLPAINQVVMVPQNAVPGQSIRVENPQIPGTYMNLNVPPNAQPGQPMMAPMPVQPNKSGGMSTGGKVALAAGGAVAVGAAAAAVYYGTAGGGVDGLMGDLGTAGGAIGDAAGAAGEWAGGAADTAGEWAGGAVDTIGDTMDGAFGAVDDFGGDALGAIGDFGGDAIDSAGDFLGSLF